GGRRALSGRSALEAPPCWAIKDHQRRNKGALCPGEGGGPRAYRGGAWVVIRPRPVGIRNRRDRQRPFDAERAVIIADARRVGGGVELGDKIDKVGKIL